MRRRSSSPHKVTILLGVLWGAAALAGDSLPLKPGLYRSQVATSMTYEGHTQTRPLEKAPDRCIRAEDLTNPDAVFNVSMLTGYKPDPTCKVRSQSLKGGMLDYRTECKDRTVHVTGTVTDDSYDVVRDVTPRQKDAVAAKWRLVGTRSGECKAK